MNRDGKEEQRGVRSTRLDVRVPIDRPCTLKRHFLGCLRQVVGLAEKLAANDPERFAWAGEDFFVKHARKRDGKRNYSQRQVRYSLATAESLGILTAAARIRRSVLRTGFIVVHHDSLAKVERTRCILSLTTIDTPLRARGQKRHDVLGRKSASDEALIASAPAPIAFPITGPISSAGSVLCLSDCPSECLSQPSQSTESVCDAQSKVANRSPKTAENGRSEPSNPVSPAKESPVNKNPANRHQETPRFICSLSALDDLDLRRRAGGDPIGLVCRALRHVHEIEDLSDYEFNTEFLEYYDHTDELIWACNEAIDELADEPFEGRKSRARVMGLAMERLRAVHRLDAPKGWYLAMTRLRERSPELRSVIHKEMNEPVNPCEVLTHWTSSLNFMDKNGRLPALAEQEPELNKLLVLAAERMGVPHCYLECRWYINAVMTCLRPIPRVILEIREELNRRIAVEDDALDGAWEQRYRGYYPRVPEPRLDASTTASYSGEPGSVFAMLGSPPSLDIPAEPFRT